MQGHVGILLYVCFYKVKVEEFTKFSFGSKKEN